MTMKASIGRRLLHEKLLRIEVNISSPAATTSRTVREAIFNHLLSDWCRKQCPGICISQLGYTRGPGNPLDEGAAFQLELLSRETCLEDLCWLFENYLCASLRKKEGVFYTPATLARRMAKEAIDSCLTSSPGTKPHELRILDPACGGGIFLVEAFKYLLELTDRNRASAAEQMEILNTCIFGIDKDPLAAQFTGLILLLQLNANESQQNKLLMPTGQIRTGDSLLQRDLYPEQNFDCIIGNPPYGLSRDEQLSADENRQLKNIYQAFRSGKINKYLAFMARGYELLRPGGCLSYVVPNAWLGIEGGAAIRKLLLAERSLHDIVIFDKPVFENVGVEAVTFLINKGVPRDSICIRTCRDAASEPAYLRCIPVSECLHTPQSVIPLQWTADKGNLYSTLKAGCQPLAADEHGFRPMIAMQAYAEGKGTPPQTREMAKSRIFHADYKIDDQYLLYLEGDNIKPYRINWSGQYLKYGPWLAEPQQLERFSGPRVLLREIINPAPYLLCACYCDYPALYNKSVLHVLPCNGWGETELQALVAVFNSRLASFLIQYAGRKSQRRVFPKIVNGDLKDFLLPRDFRRQAGKLAELAVAATGAASSGDMTRFSKLQTILDEAVSQAYNINHAKLLILSNDSPIPTRLLLPEAVVN